MQHAVREKSLILHGPFRSLNHLCNCGMEAAKKALKTEDVELKPLVVSLTNNDFIVVAETTFAECSPGVERSRENKD